MASERELKWREDYIRSGDARKATIDNFDCTNDKSIAAKTSNLKKKYNNEIQQDVMANFGHEAPQMAKILMTLAKEAKSETVRYTAARDWLFMAGFKPIERHIDLTPRKSSEEMYQELVRLVGEDTANKLTGRKTEAIEHLSEDSNELLASDFKNYPVYEGITLENKPGEFEPTR